MQSLTQKLANPTRFMSFSGYLVPVFTGLSAAFLCLYGFYLAFFVAPVDYQQGHTVKIMFVHVPVRVAGHVRLWTDCVVECRLSDLSPSDG